MGRSDEGKPVYEIHSVPYAHAGRFERPVPVESYAAGKPINREDTVCFPQHGYPLWANRFMKHHMMRPEFLPLTDVQTEDAFVVNIWTDDLEGKKPVAVFIHGGGEGSGTVPVYTGAHLAEHGVVAVTITYRIGCFGYSPVFDGDKMTANLAYYDQQAALQWVSKNIQFFGGDAGKITLMGHCGGGLACLYQLLNPVSNKLFQKLMIFAGNLPHMTRKESARESFLQAMKKQKCETVSDLRRISAKTLAARKTPLPMGDVTDGDFFADDPESLLEKDAFPAIPFSKLLLVHMEPTLMAGFLYLGAGAGSGVIVLDIAAPIFLMCGITESTSASASLLENFEIVATTIIALFVFKEAVSKRLWAAIFCLDKSQHLQYSNQ